MTDSGPCQKRKWQSALARLDGQPPLRSRPFGSWTPMAGGGPAGLILAFAAACVWPLPGIRADDAKPYPRISEEAFEFPISGPRPFPLVLLLHGWSGSKEDWWKDDNYIYGGQMRKALLEAGHVVLALDAATHGERSHEIDFQHVNAFDDPKVSAAALRHSS